MTRAADALVLALAALCALVAIAAYAAAGVRSPDATVTSERAIVTTTRDGGVVIANVTVAE